VVVAVGDECGGRGPLGGGNDPRGGAGTLAEVRRRARTSCCAFIVWLAMRREVGWLALVLLSLASAGCSLGEGETKATGAPSATTTATAPTAEEWVLAATVFLSGLASGLLGALCTIIRPMQAAMGDRDFRNFMGAFLRYAGHCQAGSSQSTLASEPPVYGTFGPCPSDRGRRGGVRRRQSVW
jgi:hypothetical protein